MLFNSYQFLWFLPLVWLVYWAFPRSRVAQNVWLLLASYFFYACWDERFLLLIAALSLVGWLGALGMERLGLHSRGGRWVFTACIVACIGVLGAFKYYDFFASGFDGLMRGLGLPAYLPLWRVVLPVGISFYTFQIIGYLADVRRGKMRATRDALSFFTFVSFFPQLVAGPIERASDLLPQMERVRRPDGGLMADGLRQMLWGFAKKMLLADRCAPIVQAIYANPMSDGTDLWWATVLFAFQIYGDFSGYSDIAIGVGKLFGVRLTQNFATPYFSRHVGEFWRRWHITLMSWFRDYLYIPLGGSRCGRRRTFGNTLAVFLVSGLWHGANWTFVAWGLYHALCFIPLLWLGRRVSLRTPVVAEGRWLPRPAEACQMGLTFLLVCIGWVFFRSPDLPFALDRLGRMATDLSLHTPYGGRAAMLCPLFFVLVEWCMRDRPHALAFRETGLLRYRAVRWAVYYALIFATLYWGGAQTAFIYFQF